jgi:hypothetical protein
LAIQTNTHEDLRPAGRRKYLENGFQIMPITVKGLNVFYSSDTGILRSNPTRDIDTYMSVFGFCLGGGLAMGRSPVRGIVIELLKVYSFIEADVEALIPEAEEKHRAGEQLEIITASVPSFMTRLIL